MNKRRRRKGAGTLQREKNGTYTIRYMLNGRRVSRTTGTSNYEKAIEVLDEFTAPFVHKDRIKTFKKLQEMIADEEQLAQMEEERRRQMLLDDSWPYYADSCRRKEVADTTLEMKRQVWAQFTTWVLLAYESGVEVRAVTPDMAEAYMRYIRNGHAASTCNNRLCYLREIYRVLMPMAKAKTNPFDGIPLLPDDCHSRRELTKEELERLLENASESGGDWRNLFLVGIYTGLRLGDCCKLTWDMIILDRGVMQLTPSKTRRSARGRVVTIPIHAKLMDVFRSIPTERRHGYVLPAMAKAYLASRPQVSSRITRIFRASGIMTSEPVEGRKCKVPVATFHSLRHTFVSFAANAGIPLHVIQSIVGHESTAMTRHYYHESEDALRKAIDAIPCVGQMTNEREEAPDEG
mgnify:CR=1 FL=1